MLLCRTVFPAYGAVLSFGVPGDQNGATVTKLEGLTVLFLLVFTQTQGGPEKKGGPLFTVVSYRRIPVLNVFIVKSSIFLE